MLLLDYVTFSTGERAITVFSTSRSVCREECTYLRHFFLKITLYAIILFAAEM